MLVFNKYFYKKEKSKLYFGNRVAALNDFIYQTGGSIGYEYIVFLWILDTNSTKYIEYQYPSYLDLKIQLWVSEYRYGQILNFQFGYKLPIWVYELLRSDKWMDTIHITFITSLRGKSIVGWFIPSWYEHVAGLLNLGARCYIWCQIMGVCLNS
jgi:hypothetical protein